MELIGALAAGLAIFAGLMAVLPTRAQPAPGLGRRVRAMYAARIGGAPIFSSNTTRNRNERYAVWPGW